jgi:hypothetical protein
MSAWTELEACLRRIVRLRERAAARSEIEREIERARRLWSDVPPSAGTPLGWPPDLAPLARELGFELGPPGAAPPDSPPEQGITAALRQRASALAIRDAILTACSIRDLQVRIAGSMITLTGSALDETTCEHAAAIARRLAPEALGVINRLVVDEQ